MKNRKWWLLFFYFVLFCFMLYQLVYVAVIFSNQKLFNLLWTKNFSYNAGDTIFYPYNVFLIYFLPLVGLFLSIISFVVIIFSQMINNQTKVIKNRFIILILAFACFIIGFYLTFTAQLFYTEWNSSADIIDSNGTEWKASDFYKYWLTLTQIWTLFALFFGLFTISIILIVKLYFLNLQWFKYVKKNNNEDMELELINPLPSNPIFNPNQTQTVTLNLQEKTLKKPRAKKQKTGQKNGN